MILGAKSGTRASRADQGVRPTNYARYIRSENYGHAAVLSLDLAGQGYDEQRSREFQRRLLDTVGTMAGIQAVGISFGLPLSPTNQIGDTIYLEGKPEPRPGDVPGANVYAITPGYLQAMHTRLVAGRDLDRKDAKDASLVALVNETLVHRLLPGENPPSAVGKRFRHSTSGKWIVSAHDPLTYLCAVGLMALVALVACWVPAHRAIHIIDPLTALRAE